jgi:hypothetical protein
MCRISLTRLGSEIEVRKKKKKKNEKTLFL